MVEIESIEQFIVEHLMPGMRRGVGSFRRLPSDQLKLATKVTKNSAVNLEYQADCRQTTLELLKWFPQSPGREFTVHVIFERAEVAGEPHEAAHNDTRVKEEKQERGRKGRKGKGRARKEAPKEEPEEEPAEEPEEEPEDGVPAHLRLPPEYALFGLPEDKGEENEEHERLAVPGTVSRKRSFEDVSGVSTPPEPATRLRTRGSKK